MIIRRNVVRVTVAAALSAISLTATADGSGTGANSWIGYVFGGNQATAPSSAVAAGSFNFASGQGSFVGAGTSNQANGISSLVIGGFDNRAVAIDALVGAGAGNRATGVRSVIVGGGYNLASGHFSFIGGGGRDGTVSTAAGTSGADNIAAGNFSTIGGGQGNTAGSASAAYATVTGGTGNDATGAYSFVAGGQNNVASGISSTVVGGAGNAATGVNSSVLGGVFNTASGTRSTVAGGGVNTASGTLSFAAGSSVIADQNQCFVFGGWSSYPSFPASCLGTTNVARFMLDHGVSVDYFSARTDGGGNRWVYIGDTFSGQTIATWTGAFLSNTGVWTNNSDRASKSDLTAVDVRDVLARLVEMPISNWRYSADDADVRHIGPMAQDFRAAFGLGQDEKHIGTVDADGVALAAIKGLHQLVREKDSEIADLKVETTKQRKEMALQRAEMAELRRSVELLLARSTEGLQLAQR